MSRPEFWANLKSKPHVCIYWDLRGRSLTKEGGRN